MAVIVVPPKLIVANLMASATQEWLNRANSMKVPGDPLFFPLWKLQVWVELHLIIVCIVGGWQQL